MLSILLFAILAAILLWFLVGTKGSWQYKLPLIIVVPFLGFLTHQIPDTYKGWPTTDRPPLTATYVGGIVEEPDAVAHTRGVIYIWMIPIKGSTSDHGLGYQSKTGEPRAYELPYTRDLHKQVDGANGILKKGGRVGVKIQNPSAHNGARVQKFLIRLYKLPNGLPPKTAG